MAKNSIRDFSATAGSNTDIQSVNIDENCPASGINNAIRELMVDLKNVSTGAVNLETPAADSLTVAGDLTVDTNTLKVDSTNNRVGIGKSTPASALHISNSTYPQLEIDDNASRNYAMGVTSSTFRIRDVTGTADRLTIDSSGNVGIGTDAPTTYGDSNTKLAVVTPTSNANDVNIRFGTNDVKGIIFVNDVSGDGVGFGTTTNDHLQFNTNNTERMRIDSSGNLLIGTTTSDTATEPGVVITSNVQPGLFINNSTTSSGVSLILLRASHSTADETKFEVTAAGNVKSRTNSYGSFSDERLKEQIADASSQWDDIKAIEVKNFKFISELDDADNPKMIGVVAQQVERVSPALVEDDADGMKTVKYSILYMKAVKALQEAMARIETLETEMTALKARVTALEA